MFALFRKTTKVEHAQTRVDLLPLAKDAIQQLGLFKRSEARWLAQFIAANFNQGTKNIALSMRKQGRQMDKETRKTLGLGRAMMSYDLWERFNSSDLKNASERLEQIVLRICIHAYKIGKYGQMKRSGKSVFGDDVIIKAWGSPRKPCQKVKPILGKPMPFNKCPQLPISGCDAVVCYCDLEPAWLSKKRNR